MIHLSHLERGGCNHFGPQLPGDALLRAVPGPQEAFMRKARSLLSCFVLVVASASLQGQTPPGGTAIVQIELSPGSAQETQSPRPPDPVQNAEPRNQRSEPAHLASPDMTVAATQSERLKIILLKPSVRFEDIHKGVKSEWGLRESEAIKSTKPLGAEENYENLLLSAARSEVAPKALLLEREKLDSSTTEACAKLEALTSRLARGNVNEAATSALTELAALDEHYAILAQFVRLETGPGRSWNPNTGSITSSTDSTLLQVALISGKTGKVIWKGERLIRNKALRPTDSGFSKAITELYRDFDTK